MIKLFIADDEEIIRNGIRQNVDWKNNGVTICGEASDGDTAFELLKATNPDIAILDIRMPGLSGIEIIEALKPTSIDTKIIILSGYDDFSYAQKALKMGVLDYLLKPCRSKDILKAVLNVKNTIETENRQKENYAVLKKQYDENYPILKNTFLTEFLENKILSAKELSEGFNRYDIGLKDNEIMAAVFKINNYSLKDITEIEINLMKFSIKNVADETLDKKSIFETFYKDDYVVTLLNSDQSTYDDISQCVKAAKEYIDNNLWFDVSVGIGSIYPRLNEAYLSFNEALAALDYCFFSQINFVLSKDIPSVEKSPCYPKVIENVIINAVLLGKKNETKKYLHAFINDIAGSYPSKDNIQKSCFVMLQSLQRACNDNPPFVNSDFDWALGEMLDISKYSEIEQFEIELIAIVMGLFDTVNDSKVHNYTISKTLKYMEENYDKPLTLETAANFVFINPKYLSSLFKQSTGRNFTDYLQKVRIDKACKLLKDTHYKIYEIADKVGFKDKKYFCQRFKKITGLTPSQYRKTI